MRPSEIYFIKDEVAAWCFDRAIWLFGGTLESELAAAENKAKNPRQAHFRRQEVMKRWLGIEMKFRDPVARHKTSKDKKDVDSTVSGPVVL